MRRRLSQNPIILDLIKRVSGSMARLQRSYQVVKTLYQTANAMGVADEPVEDMFEEMWMEATGPFNWASEILNVPDYQYEDYLINEMGFDSSDIVTFADETGSFTEHRLAMALENLEQAEANTEELIGQLLELIHDHKESLKANPWFRRHGPYGL